MSHVVLDELCRNWPPHDWCDTTVVLAVSGGPDSVALLLAASQAKSLTPGRGQLIAAHFNHGYRGAESDADQDFVESLCARLHVICRSHAAPVASDAPSEEAARLARYHFLRAVVAQSGARYLATAHTADDQAETVLHRIVRGTGLEGLAGIPRRRELIPGVTLIRPLLSVPRRMLLEYLGAHDQDYRTDSSNASRRYTRNRLRLDLLPRLEADYNPQVRQALERLAGLASEANQIIQRRVDELFASAVRECGRQRIVLVTSPLSRAEPYLIRALLKMSWQQAGWPLADMSHDKWQSLAQRILRSESTVDRFHLPGNVAVERRAEVVTLTTPT